jgi:hypothetical protein
MILTICILSAIGFIFQTLDFWATDGKKNGSGFIYAAVLCVAIWDLSLVLAIITMGIAFISFLVWLVRNA